LEGFPPTETFDDQDFLSYKGAQTYEYVVIPLSRSIDEFPATELLYFDTNMGAFNTLRTDPVAVVLAGESIIEYEEGNVEESVVMSEPKSQQNVSEKIVWKLGSMRSLERPFFEKPLFWMLNAIAALGFSFSVWKHVEQLRMNRNPALIRRRKAEQWKRKYLKLAQQASRLEDSEQFYESAFLSFGAVICSGHDRNVESVTVEDVLNVIEGLDLNENSKRVVESYLIKYESHRFSGRFDQDPPLKHEFSRLLSILNRVEKSTTQIRKKRSR
jgi:hypothetical protein